MKIAAFGGLFALMMTSASAATLVDNVHGYSLDAAGKLETFDALLVNDAGKVEATGEAAKAMGKGADHLDGHGATLLPGLIDAHGHVMSLGEALTTVDLQDTKSLAEAQARIRDFAKAHPDAPWIMGRGWNQVNWKLGRFPTAAELDAAVSDRPVWMERVDGHAGWINSKALALTGITAATKDPHGGRIERNASGAPSGVFVDGAMDLVTSHIPAPTRAQEEQALTAALKTMNSVGLTGVGDAGIDPETWDLYKSFGANGRLTVRIYAMIHGMANFRTMGKGGPIGWMDNDHLALRALKLFADGALGSRGAALIAPYSDDPKNKGLLFMTQDEMNADVKQAASAGFQVNIHAIGDAANREVVNAFAQAPREGLRHRIEHAQIMAPGDIERAAKLGIIASMQPTHATSDRIMAESRLDPVRLKGAYAWRSWLNAGAKLALGSDFPVESPNPFFGLHAAVTRQGHDDQPPGGWRMDEALNLKEALYGFTRGAAYAEFAEKKFGSLEPGMWADFILIDRDIFHIDPKQIWKTKVKETWVGGKRVWCAPESCN